MELKIGEYVMIAPECRDRVDDIIPSRQADFLKACQEPFVAAKWINTEVLEARYPDDDKQYIRLDESWFVKCDPPAPPPDPDNLMELLL